jgi:hypothetical protein
MSESWSTRGIAPDALDALRRGLPPSELWSLLMQIMTDRARREPARILDQWQRDGFTAPAAIDQRLLVEMDRVLLAAAPQFDAIEFSPLAPLGACSSVALTSQHRVVAALRGCEVVSDPTNVMALECARRLRRNPHDIVRIATAQRCVRAQPFPKLPGFAAHFRIFCLATGTAKGPDHDAVVQALVEQIQVLTRALAALEAVGIVCPVIAVKVLSIPERSGLADRVAAGIGSLAVRDELQHRYYDGLRFMVVVRTASGQELPIADGGMFNWLTRLTSNRKLAFVASGVGTQLLATQCLAGT